MKGAILVVNDSFKLKPQPEILPVLERKIASAVLEQEIVQLLKKPSEAISSAFYSRSEDIGKQQQEIIKRVLSDAFIKLPENERKALSVESAFHADPFLESLEEMEVVEEEEVGFEGIKIIQTMTLPLPENNKPKSNLNPKKWVIVRVGCYLPVTLIPKRLLEQIGEMGFPAYSQAAIMNKKIHACIYLGPFSLREHDVAYIIKSVENRFGVSNLFATEFRPKF